MIARTLVIVVATPLWLMTMLASAMADPAGPSNYQTFVVGIDPPAHGFEIEVIGGDSFIRLTVEPGHLVEVVGYGGEPYLRFEGPVVVENELAPTKYTNEDRYAVSEIPDFASASADPSWVEVSDNGSYAWHDHRSHWMNPDPPPGAGPGDQILEGVIPLVVDGVDVDVTMASVWVPAPSVWPLIVGTVVGVGLGLLAWRQSPAGVAVVLLMLAILATGVSLAAFVSVPAETAPSVVAWLVPLTAGGLAVWAWRDPTRATTLLAVSALELAIWGWTRREWMTSALLPTGLPYWIDRTITAAVLGGALIILWSVAQSLWRGRVTPSTTVA